MMQSKLLDLWGSFQTNEKRMIKIILFLLPINHYLYLSCRHIKKNFFKETESRDRKDQP